MTDTISRPTPILERIKLQGVTLPEVNCEPCETKSVDIESSYFQQEEGQINNDISISNTDSNSVISSDSKFTEETDTGCADSESE